MPFFRCVLLVSCLSVAASAQTADQIMARVAVNQDASLQARTHYIYVQHAHVRSLKGNTVRCDETTDARIVPTEKGYKQVLLKLDGRVLHKGKYIAYTERDVQAAAKDAKSTEKDSDDIHVILADKDDDSTDMDLVENMRDNLTKDPKAKDGMSAGLFPLTTDEQKDYIYTLVGREPMNGRETFHVRFQPKDKDDFGWKGDAWIDAEAYQPVLVRTALSRNIPFAVRTLLGTSLPGLGFSVTYEPEPGGVKDAPWFPVTFGTEFKLHVLFFFNREVVIDVHNRDFEQTHVTSTLHAGGEVQ